MTDRLTKLANERAAAYNLPFDEAYRQAEQIERDRLADEYDDHYFDHMERDHDEPYEPDADYDYDDEHDPFRDDVEADADTLAQAGYGTDEDYGCFGGDEW